MRCVAFVLMLLTAASAGAHGLDLKVKVTGSLVTVTAAYDDATPIADAIVTVVRVGEAAAIAEGVTDKDGLWSFATPTAGEYEVRLNAGAGHRAKRKLVIDIANHITNEMPAEADSKFNRSTKAIAGLVMIAAVFCLWHRLLHRRSNRSDQVSVVA